MTKRYRIDLSYDGARYHGWQKQPEQLTVQGEIEKALSILFRHEVVIMGSGRTDTGVHAEHQVAHFDLPVDIVVEKHRVLQSIRGLLTQDILVSSIESVPDDFHARFDATSRRYRYQIATSCNVFRDQYSWVVKDIHEVSKMVVGAELFIGEHDFTSFCKQNPDVNHNGCHVYKSYLYQYSDNEWHYHIEANRFLHHMVRSIVSSLVLVGRGKIQLNDISKYITQPDKSNFRVTAPAHALFLEKVSYTG